MPGSLSRPVALAVAALLTFCFVGWLSLGQSQAVGLWQADSQNSLPPTPEPTATPLPTGTATPTPTPTPRPVLLPTPTPEPTILDVAGQVMNVILTSAVWIWLTCGSLLFFAVAGAIAGFSFYHNSRQRFDLYEIVPEADDEAPARPPRRKADTGGDDDAWPSSLP